MGKFTLFKTLSFLPIFFRASRKRASEEMPQSISTCFTLYPSIYAVITNTFSCGKVTYSVSDSEKEITSSPLPYGASPTNFSGIDLPIAAGFSSWGEASANDVQGSFLRPRHYFVPFYKGVFSALSGTWNSSRIHSAWSSWCPSRRSRNRPCYDPCRDRTDNTGLGLTPCTIISRC